VIALANDQQAVQNFYAYTPYGETQTLGPDEGNAIQYTARENDQTGLYYYRARYYDPVLTRFVSEDPIGMAAGTNFYAYVGGDPITYNDPLGTFPGGLPGINQAQPPEGTCGKLQEIFVCLMCLFTHTRPIPPPPPPTPIVRPQPVPPDKK
jgi:RHS repeat-associated protein